MKLKERRGNVFVFDGGYDLEELELVYFRDAYIFRGVVIRDDMKLACNVSWVELKDIQTAVNLMTILKNEGLV